VICHNVLNCELRYHISLDSIMNTDIQPRDIIGRINANDNHLAVLPLLRELLRCRDSNLCLSNHNVVLSDTITMIICALFNIDFAREMYFEYNKHY